jgi:hypothetical protein
MTNESYQAAPGLYLLVTCAVARGVLLSRT